MPYFSVCNTNLPLGLSEVLRHVNLANFHILQESRYPTKEITFNNSNISHSISFVLKLVIIDYGTIVPTEKAASAKKLVTVIYP